ncbi:MAG: flavocytochrome c [Deltaproteobacteria bacterium]|nr:flavocytochrome c [Deltaproteobacteria bacterium]
MKDKDNGKATRLSRRDFLKVTGGAAALAGMGAGSLMLPGDKAHAAVIPKKWDETYDVVIIGSGFAGLAAAIEAKNAGSSALVLEKMPVPGGNSIINGGLIAAAGTPLQDKEGIKDTPDLMVKDMLKAGLGLNHPDLARTVAEQSRDTVLWTVDYLGVKYKERVTHLGGHSVPRSYYTTESSGAGIVRPQLAKVKELGLEVRTRAYLEHILKDEDGRVKGVKILEGYKFPKASSGKGKLIKARKAVVLATGGFGSDVKFRTIQDPRLTDKLDCTNQPGATAEGMMEAFRLGATPVQVSWIQLGPWACPDEKGMGIGYIFAISAAFPYGLMVAPETGRRFVNELADRKVRADAIIKTGRAAIGIADETGVKRTAMLDKMLEKGIVKKFDTLEALAAAYNINVPGLKEEVAKYNKYLSSGTDQEFGRPFQKDAKAVETPPFYGMRLWPKVHHTMGGIQINPKAQVIDLAGTPIAGFFAAGEVTGGVHGAVRLGSNAIADCLVLGRIAGRSAASTDAWG